MTQTDFSGISDEPLIKAAFDVKLGFDRARAIVELANRALVKPALLESACKAISSDRRLGFHERAPLGWFGADQIFLSGQQSAIGRLLKEMNHWADTEQEDLVRHWAGKGGLRSLTLDLKRSYGWTPLYKLPG